MKHIYKLIIVTVIFFDCRVTDAQTYTYNTTFYDYLWGSLYSDEVGEDITAYRPKFVRGYSGFFFTAGEYAKGESTQGVYVATFHKDGTPLKSVVYNDNNYREYVKKVVATYKSLYVICNAINISTGDSTLQVLRYNMDLELKQNKRFTTSKYSSPADAVSALSASFTYIDEIYLACSKKDNTKNALAIIHLDSNLNILHSASYNYTGSEDAYEERAVDLDIAYDDAIGETIYAAGGVSGPNGNAGCLLVKLNGNLNIAWSKSGNPSLGASYNSVKQAGAPAYDAYVCGGPQTNGNFRWKISRIDPQTGITLDSARYTKDQFQTNALKITAVGKNKVTVAGFEQSSALNKYDIVIAQYSRNLTTPVYNTLELTSGSTVNDALQDKTTTWVTGSKKSGQDRYMFVYKIEASTGALLYENYVQNSKAAGNRLAALTGGASYPDSTNIAVTGFKNKSANIFQPEDLIYLTRIYSPHFTSKAVKTIPLIASPSLLEQNIPNPFANTTTINYNLPNKYSSSKIIVADELGNTIKNIDLSGTGKGSIRFSSSLKGGAFYTYSLYVDGKLIDTKRMEQFK
jgi:hypothetical protein